MCLVSGDQENLSSMPRGIKIISELQDIEWKQRADGFASADMCHSLHGDAPPVVDTSVHQPTQTGVWQEKKNKNPLLIWPQSPVTSARTHSGRGKCTWTLWGDAMSHPTSAPPPSTPLSGDRTGGSAHSKIRDGFAKSTAACKGSRSQMWPHRKHTHWHTFGSRTLSSVVRQFSAPRTGVSTHASLRMIERELNLLEFNQSRILSSRRGFVKFGFGKKKKIYYTVF